MTAKRQRKKETKKGCHVKLRLTHDFPKKRNMEEEIVCNRWKDLADIKKEKRREHPQYQPTFQYYISHSHWRRDNSNSFPSPGDIMLTSRAGMLIR